MTSYVYVPALRWKEGERAALSNLSESAKAQTRPLLTLAPAQYVGKKATLKHAPVPASERVVDDLTTCWGQRPIFFDASGVPASTDNAHPIAEVAELAAKRGLVIVPVSGLGVPSPYREAALEISQRHKTGIGLRIDLEEFATAKSWAPDWKIPLADTDLIVDFEDNVQHVASLGSTLKTVFRDLFRGSDWRSCTILGTSLPANFTAYSAGLHRINRSELKLWKTLSEDNLPYRLAFGDYTTVALEPPPSGIRWGYPINVKYTQPNEIHVCRGVRTVGKASKEMHVQLKEHSQTIAGLSTRQTLPNCWADNVIDQIASGKISPGALPKWVGISVNRHIEITTEMLG